MIGALFVMVPLAVAIGAMACAVRRLPCDACGTCTRCTGRTVSEMIRERQS